MEIEPMLLTETWDKSILKDKTKYFQLKENGVRALVHVKDNKIIGIRNRAGHPILYQFPEFRDIVFDFSVGILDCEICVFKGLKSVFYGGIDQRRSTPSERVLKDCPATIVVFDALKIDNEVLLNKPYKYRYEKIHNIKETDKVWVIKNFEPDWLWNEVVVNDYEGIVIKDPNMPYEIGKRVKHQLKLKNYKTTEVLVEKVEENEKGTKIFGKSGEITVEAQLAGIFGVQENTTQLIKYLDIVGNRYIQPTKVTREQVSI